MQRPTIKKAREF